eukprot:11996414-Alexandrium_andersonii.AAC.1
MRTWLQDQLCPLPSPATEPAAPPAPVMEAAAWALQDLGVEGAAAATHRLAHWFVARATARDQQ